MSIGNRLPLFLELLAVFRQGVLHRSVKVRIFRDLLKPDLGGIKAEILIVICRICLTICHPFFVGVIFRVGIFEPYLFASQSYAVR